MTVTDTSWCWIDRINTTAAIAVTHLNMGLMTMCKDVDCMKCERANLRFPGLDFLMWRSELGWPTVLDNDLVKGV